jgi:hypothetical protein
MEFVGWLAGYLWTRVILLADPRMTRQDYLGIGMKVGEIVGYVGTWLFGSRTGGGKAPDWRVYDGSRM